MQKFHKISIPMFISFSWRRKEEYFLRLILTNRLFSDTKMCENVAEHFVGGNLPRDFA